MLSFLYHQRVWFSWILPLNDRRVKTESKIVNSTENKANANSLS
jgi:hypothetical protein